MIHLIICFYATKMEDFLSPFKNRRKILSGSSSAATAGGGRDGVDPRAKVELVRTRRGFLDVPGGRFGKAAWGVNYRNDRKPSKLLLNVNLQNSVGPVQVVMSPENTVHDLKKAVVEIYVREKRRPLLACSDPRCFVLHYSPFSLEGLKPEEKLKNLVSRNFFLFLKPGNAFVNPSCLDQANVEHKSPFPLVKLMDYLL